MSTTVMRLLLYVYNIPIDHAQIAAKVKWKHKLWLSAVIAYPSYMQGLIKSSMWIASKHKSPQKQALFSETWNRDLSNQEIQEFEPQNLLLDGVLF